MLSMLNIYHLLKKKKRTTFQQYICVCARAKYAKCLDHFADATI